MYIYIYVCHLCAAINIIKILLKNNISNIEI